MVGDIWFGIWLVSWGVGELRRLLIDDLICDVSCVMFGEFWVMVDGDWKIMC